MGKHRKKQPKISEILPVSTCLHLTRYTFDTWCKTQYPGQNIPEEAMRREWEEKTLTGDVYGFAGSSVARAEENNLGSFDSALICPLDEEYLQYLADNHLPHSSTIAAGYASRMSREKAYELLQKTHMDMQYTVAYLPVTLVYPSGIVDTTHFVLSDVCRVLLQKYIGRIVGRENVYVGKNLFTLSAAIDNEDELRACAMEYFEKGTDISRPEWEKQHIRESEGNWMKNEDSEIIFLHIPVVMRSRLTSAYIPIDVDQLPFEIYPFNYPLEPESFYERSISVPPIEETRFAEKLAEMFGEVYDTIFPCLVLVDDMLDDEYDDEIFGYDDEI